MTARLPASVLAATFVALFSVSSAAQVSPAPSSTSPWSVFGGAAVGSVYDDEGSLGKGPELSLGIGKALSPRWSFEAIVFRHQHERTDAFRVDADVTGAIGRINVHFGSQDAAARFFLAAGAGVAHHSGTIGFASLPEAPEPLRSFSATGLVTEVGTGVDVRVGTHWFIRPEVRARWTSVERPTGGPEPPYISGLAGVSVGWKW